MRADSSNLDLLRSVAVTFVVVSHLLLGHSLSGEGIYHTQTLGTLGVLIFFVHTCLVLMLSLERQATKENGYHSTFLFLIRRAFRIYPLSIVAVIVVSSLAWIYSATPPNGRAILSNLLLIQNFTGHGSIPRALWSLPFEFQMYLFLPALYMLVSYQGKRAPYLVGAVWFAAVVLVLAFWMLGWNVELVKFFPCFLPGVLAFSLRRSARDYWPAMLFLLVAATAVLYPWMVARGASATLLSWPICLALGLIIPRCREIEFVWLQRAGRVIARYSFGIYLVHGPMIDFSFHYFKDMPPVIPWLVFFTGTIGLSCIAYHVIEKPCTELGRILVERLMTYRMQQKGNA
ncbi:acyltransferase family protein [Noviherbaspirillum sedimenti]|uniref:Acyltransferase n=1 Tax=Noviherbaspirillum sedimenti TaxID=2320865 RepID=A0A3A3G029_9BURK|nr:acyltransferase [Noviherbaspirillum sedimenti]RJG01281.1 acyltransferase [Noviherbaspirillum sedimenti]